MEGRLAGIRTTACLATTHHPVLERGAIATCLPPPRTRCGAHADASHGLGRRRRSVRYSSRGICKLSEISVGVAGRWKSWPYRSQGDGSVMCSDKKNMKKRGLVYDVGICYRPREVGRGRGKRQARPTHVLAIPIFGASSNRSASNVK